MAIVMPRSRSSGALSIWSKATYLFVWLALASTLVIAAVKVVLPWSMCPIVPTFTCGLLRSNFSFAISSVLRPATPDVVFGAKPHTGRQRQPLLRLLVSLRPADNLVCRLLLEEIYNV